MISRGSPKSSFFNPCACKDRHGTDTARPRRLDRLRDRSLDHRIQGAWHRQPREWIEWLERQFTDKRMLQFIGAVTAVVAGFLAYYGTFSSTPTGWLFALSLVLLALVGVGLAVGTNHMRLLVVATAETDDKYIRITSIIFTVAGLFWALTPWF